MSDNILAPGLCAPRPWDARLARSLVAPLASTRITPNHLTTVRLAVGLAGAAAFTVGTYRWSNIAALLVVLSNFLDHADGELARISGKTSRIGHIYDLASDAAVTILLFVAMGVGIGINSDNPLGLPPPVLGAVAGAAVALIFYLRMRIEGMAGKTASRQASLGGFETEDVLYLLPLVTLSNGIMPYLIAASIGAPLFAAWVVIDYRRVLRRLKPMAASPTSGAGLV
jgi:phosphatidylglycerophosphate synthase